MRRQAWLFFATLVAACGGDTLSVGGDQPLDKDDVQGLPAGSGSGTAASGAYIITAADQRSCACSGADEAELCDTSLAAGALWFVQDEGALELRLAEGAEILEEVVLTGGIDADGAFEVGGLNVVSVGGSTAGETINAVEGAIQPRDGGTLSWRMQSQLVSGGSSIECSMVFDLEFSWWDPASLASCSTDADCHPERPSCVERTCTDGVLGGPCTFGNDCASGFCVDDVCTEGMSGDPCALGSDCISETCEANRCTATDDCAATGCDAGMICFQQVCQEGAEGDPCETPLQCTPGLKCFAQRCQDGSPGDPCEGPLDCDGLSGYSCTADGVCG